MFESLERSWNLTKLSFKVMQQDKELFLFPVLAGIFSVLFIVAMLFPTVILALLAGGTPAEGPTFYLLLFIIYLGLAVIATFFNVCVVYTVKQRLAGKNASFGDSVKFAFSRIGVIFAWGLISATVGLLLRAIEQIGERFGFVGEIVAHIITGILGAVWSVLTIFVIPVMVYENVGPFDAIKGSANSLQKTWGENIVGFIGFGLVEFFFLFAGVVGFIITLLLTASLGAWWIATLILLAVFYVVGVIIFFNLAGAIFRTALYEYSKTGKVPGVYPEEYVKGAVRKKN